MQDEALPSRSAVRVARRIRRFGILPAGDRLTGDGVVVFMTVIGCKRMTGTGKQLAGKFSTFLKNIISPLKLREGRSGNPRKFRNLESRGIESISSHPHETSIRIPV